MAQTTLVPHSQVRMPAPGTFEIGLVMAGAISAGAYTAGVVDFLTEALQAFYARRRTANGPGHEVKIAAAAGASAGGIGTALMAAGFAGRPRQPGTRTLHDAWVDDIDIEYLLQTRDLDAAADVLSLLDSTVLGEITSKALDLAPRPELPDYVARPLPLYLTVANLRGVPYVLKAAGTASVAGHAMVLHADHMKFLLRNARGEPSHADAFDLDREDVGRNGWWPLLGNSALATSAFPLGLQSQILTRPRAQYGERVWPVPNADPPPCTLGARIPPDWPNATPENYELQAVDGGLMNNEPLELARLALAGPGGRNPREPDKANRAVVLVDPFPEDVEAIAAFESDRDLIAVATRMFGALKSQARFKPDELALALDEDTFSRFLIAPSRREPGATKPTEPAICSAILGGFGGFLLQAFREHDYQLGRRNCQQFLRKHFRIAAGNPVFGGWREPRFVEPMRYRDREVDSLPVIPIWDEDLPEEPLPPRPAGSEVPVDRLTQLVRARVGAVGGRLIERKVGGLTGTALKLLWFTEGRKRVTDAIMAKIRSELWRL